MSEIEKVANHFGRSLASDEVCSDKTGVDTEKKISAEIAVTANTSASPKAVVLAGMLC